MIKHILFKVNKKCLARFIVNMVYKGLRGIKRFQKNQEKGNFYPAFHFISVTDECNLNCQGCWVTGKKIKNTLTFEQIDKIILESKAQGNYFFGILGGEPLMYKGLMGIFEKHTDCYFQLFTNGILLNKSVARQLKKIANVTPLISFEGDKEVADIRRGGKNVYSKTWDAVINSTNAGLITGVAMSVCKSNIELAFSNDFIKSLQNQGVLYLWYYIYRPVGQNSKPELALSKEEIWQLRTFLIEARKKYKIVIIDAYWDAYGKGLCPAASGLSHHINASGDIEPCPVVQFATNNIAEGKLKDIYSHSSFLKDFRETVSKQTSGCILMDDPLWLVEFVRKHKAKDTSGRENEEERLLAMNKTDSHGAIENIPESKWIYRFSKKYAFFGLGAYG